MHDISLLIKIVLRVHNYYTVLYIKRGGALYNELTYGTADTEKLPGGAVFKGLHCTQYGGQFLFKMAKKDGR